MNVLWINPSFLDYRIPMYTELKKLFEGNFNLLYSKHRVPERCHNRIVEELGENAHYLTSEKIYKFGNTNSDFANSSLSIPFPTGLYKNIKKIRPEAIIAEGFFQFTPWAVIYSFIHRIPLFIAYERTEHTERNCPIWRKLYRRFIGLFVDGYIANGVLTKRYLISQGVNEKKVFTGGMCADSKRLKIYSQNMSENDKDFFSKSIGLNHISGIRYIYVGRIIKLKGINYLLDAWLEHLKEYPNDEILIVGEGDLLESYISQYQNVPSIKFMGSADYSEIYKYYAISDVFIIPTLEDNWSLVVPEAMACGLPIACSIYNGCHPELVKQGKNGYTFDPLIKKSIIECLGKFHNSNIENMGTKSIEIESNFSPQKTAQNVKSMLDTLIN